MKKPNGKKKDHQARYISEIRRLTKHFVYWRLHADDDPSELVTNKVLFGPNPRKVPKENVEHEMQALSLKYQCVTISYCRTPFGARYRSFGFAQTNDPLRLVDVNLSPLITAAKHEAETDINTRQLYARGMVLMPYVRDTADILSVVRRLKDELGLTEEDFVQLEGVLDGSAVYYEFDEEPNLDTEEQIKALPW